MIVCPARTLSSVARHRDDFVNRDLLPVGLVLDSILKGSDGCECCEIGLKVVGDNPESLAHGTEVTLGLDGEAE